MEQTQPLGGRRCEQVGDGDKALPGVVPAAAKQRHELIEFGLSMANDGSDLLRLMRGHSCWLEALEIGQHQFGNVERQDADQGEGARLVDRVQQSVKCGDTRIGLLLGRRPGFGVIVARGIQQVM